MFLSTFSRSSLVQNIDLAVNYQEAISDTESGRGLQPRYMKAIETGNCQNHVLKTFKFVDLVDHGKTREDKVPTLGLPVTLKVTVH